MVACAILTSGGSSSSCLGNELPAAAEGAIDFQRDVQPLLARHCLSCHGPEKQEAGLRLDSRAAALLGGDSGKAIDVGHSANSRLIRYVAGVDPEQLMPPEGERLNAVEIGKLRAWIDRGLDWPQTDVTQSVNTHWAYQPLRRPAVPTVLDNTAVENPIDRFIMAGLDERGVSLSPAADRSTLIRRLYLDLLGLLPTAEQVDAFLEDARPDAYARLVDSLLASPHFGERWGRHWLDMARYADSDGYEKDNPRPDAYRWRDWVIDAFNDDMSFAQFTREQLAGDLLPEATAWQQLATAFHRQTLTNTEGGTDQEQFRVEACFDRTETTGTVWLGLTIGCARCHTHKYDAITQREYYQLFAFFNNWDEHTHSVPRNVSQLREYEWRQVEHTRQIDQLRQKLRDAQRELLPKLAQWEEDLRAGKLTDTKLPEKLTPIATKPAQQRSPAEQQQLLDHYSQQAAETKELHAQLNALKKEAPTRELSVRVLRERDQARRPTYVLRRGEFLEPIEETQVAPAGLSTLPPLTSRHGSQVPPDRVDLADWLASPANPLTARVAVNHLWRLLFGEGLVRTANDFGVRGQPPTHPELLDWLAIEFATHQQWSRKQLIGLIVSSATYRQSSYTTHELAQSDPQNVWLARQNRIRVEGEIVRDLSLDAAGLLARTIGGPSVYPQLPPGIAELSYAGNFKWTTSSGEDLYRRGMYTFFKRTSPHPNLILFDCPDANLTCVGRNSSNTPLQALVTLNNASFTEAAQALARRILTVDRPTIDQAHRDEDRLTEAFRICLSRRPSSFERDQLVSLLQDARTWYQGRSAEAKQLVGNSYVTSQSTEETAAWIATMRVLINLDEFITRQ